MFVSSEKEKFLYEDNLKYGDYGWPKGVPRFYIKGLLIRQLAEWCELLEHLERVE